MQKPATESGDGHLSDPISGGRRAKRTKVLFNSVIGVTGETEAIHREFSVIKSVGRVGSGN